MKNKEIEELLNKIRNSIKTHKKLNLDDDMLVVLEFDVIQWNLLLSYIEQIENNRDKAIEYLKQPYRDNFDYSKAELINILESDKE